MSEGLSVGTVAKRAGVKVSALHFYEQKGLISSWRNGGNQRRYHRDVLKRVAVIKAAQQVGLPLAEIKQALAVLPEHKAPSKEEWEAMARLWQQSLEQRIRQLQGLRDNLGSCIGCGCLSMKNCPLYNPKDIMAQRGSGAQLLTYDSE